MPIITPVATPTSIAPESSASKAASARAKAIAILSGNTAVADNAQAEAVANPTQVSPEELSAVKSASHDPKVQETTDKSELSDSTVETKEEKKEPLSSQFAVLARKEKALLAKAQKQEAAFKAREEALAAREAALTAKDSEYQSDYIPKNRLLEDTLGTLAEAGIDYEQLTQLALNPPPKQDPATKAYIAKLEAQIAKINGTLEQQVKSAQDSQTQAYQQALKQIERDASKLVQASEDFEAIRSTNSIKDVVKLIEKTYQEEGYVMDTDIACKEVEDYLVEESFKLTQLKKVQQRLQANKAPETKAPQQTTEPTAAKQSQPMKTLTNSVGVSRQLSARERAILAMKGELK